ncbi:MAG: hemerythrin family protein [Bacteroidota bacterium]|nr:hemerythrin family protein [Bacteroidota bacterium]
MKGKKEFDKLSWTDDFSSGLVYLDNHRRNFLDILNELVEVVNEDNCETMLPMIFHRLAFYAEDYFTNKEIAMQECQHLPLHNYRAEHDRFTKAIGRFHDEFRKGSLAVCRDMLVFLLDWFQSYIETFGNDSAEYLRKRGYE